MTSQEILFFITTFTELISISSLIVTLVSPRLHIWPPIKRKSWQFIATWGFLTTSVIGIILLSILDWNSLTPTYTTHYIVGIALILGGLFFLMWSVRTLSIQTSLGLGDKLIKYGPYKFTRNPQYLSMILIIIGIIVLSNSFYTLISGIIGITWFLMAPFVEEPWLEKQYGEDYTKYCESVPRFLII